ncbi:MAG: leucine-rich repeat protein [Lachnospiraceae bacterium]|nr:leucine-rich repeat protein [Lachnospiraceae bacterium]
MTAMLGVSLPVSEIRAGEADLVLDQEGSQTQEAATEAIENEVTESTEQVAETETAEAIEQVQETETEKTTEAVGEEKESRTKKVEPVEEKQETEKTKTRKTEKEADTEDEVEALGVDATGTQLATGKTFTVDKVTYEVTGRGEVWLTDGSKCSGTYQIPSKVTYKKVKYTVTGIGQCALSYSSVKKLSIPACIKTIHQDAFVSMPSLETITVDDGNTEYVAEDGVLYTRDHLWLYTYPLAKKGDTFVMNNEVRYFAFSSMFSDTKYLKKLVLSQHLYQESPISITNSSIETIEVDKKNKKLVSKDGILYSKDGKTLLLYPNSKKDKIYFVPSSVEKIGNSSMEAFSGNKYLEELYIPAGVKTMEGKVAGCTSLRKVVFAKNARLSKIEYTAFHDCPKIERICYPASVKEFYKRGRQGEYFSNCTSLKALYAAKGAGLYTSTNYRDVWFTDCNPWLVLYGQGTGNEWSYLAANHGYSYMDVSTGYDQVLGVTFADLSYRMVTGQQKKIPASVYPENSTAKKLSYESSNTKVARVDQNGKVSAVGKGSCYITAKATDGSGEYARCKIEVTALEEAAVSVSNTSSGVQLKWKKTSDADEYCIYRKSGKEGWKKLTTIKSGSTLKYTDKTAKANKKYTYAVQSCRGSLKSVYGKKSVAIMYLKQPGSVKAAKDKKGIRITWKKCSGVSGYYVLQKSGNGKWKKIATVKGAGKSSYLDKKVKKGKKYTYTVQAYSRKYTSSYASGKTIKK